jgi:hypothetical protein
MRIQTHFDVSPSSSSRAESASEQTLSTSLTDESRVQDQASRLIQALDLAIPPKSMSRHDGAVAAGAASTLLGALDLAVAQSEGEIANLPSPERDILEMLNHYIATGELPQRGAYPPDSVIAQAIPSLEDDEWFDARSSLSEESERWSDAHSIQSWQSDPWEDARSHISSRESVGYDTASLAGSEAFGSTASSTANADSEAPSPRLNRVLQFITSTLHNDFSERHARRAANVANDALRNVASVGIPTFVRQAVAYAIERGLLAGRADVAARTALGAVAGALPLALNMAGLVRDNYQGTATTATNVARSLNFLIGAGALAVAGATCSLATMAANLTAYSLVYGALRDAVESVLRLRDNAPAKDARAIAAFTATTAVNQFVANAIMSQGASPSGQSAAAQGWPALNDLTRAVVNTASNTVGDLLSYVFVDRLATTPSREHLRVQLETSLPSLREAPDIVLNKLAVRANVTNNIGVWSEVLGNLVNQTGLGTGQAQLVKDAISAGLATIHYPLTSYALMQQPRPASAEVEPGNGA